MKTPGASTLKCAVAGCFAAAACSAQAVYLSPDGTGQALLYPYYTVQSANGNAFNTYLSVVNTTSRAKAVKVRFLEGKNARKALDFNLYLSPNDVWTAAMGPQDASDQSPAILATADKSCTAPPIPAGGVAFRNFYYSTAFADGAGTGLDRTREGYVEVIEMATLAGSAAASVTHNAAGVPANCAFVQPENGFRAGTDGANAYLRPPNGGIAGTFTLINVANGLNFAGDATALGGLFAAPNFADTDSLVPNLASADPVAATVAPNSAGGGGMVGYRATYASGRDAVSATLMKSALVNEFALDAGTRSATDFVATFPTKAFHVPSNGGTTSAPFTSTFAANGACESVGITVFNRESSGVVSTPPDIDPIPPGFLPSACWTAQVISLIPVFTVASRSSVLGSANVLLAPVNNFPNGWAQIVFTGQNTSVGIPSLAGTASAVDMAAGRSYAHALITHKGLPVIGFAVRTLNNGLLNCTPFGGAAGTCVGSYGLLTDHRYFVNTSPTP